MNLSAGDRRTVRSIASETGLDAREAGKAVSSFFYVLLSEFRSLPFNSPGRIYTPAAFSSLSKVFNIPYIGRVGTMYSKYRKWRASVSAELDTINRSDIRQDSRRDMLDTAYHDAIHGRQVDASAMKGRNVKGRYTTVWLIDENGHRKVARQVIKK